MVSQRMLCQCCVGPVMASTPVTQKASSVTATVPAIVCLIICTVLCHCNNLLGLILSTNRLWWCTNSHSWLGNELCITDVRSTCEAFIGCPTFCLFPSSALGLHSRPPAQEVSARESGADWLSEWWCSLTAPTLSALTFVVTLCHPTLAFVCGL